MLEEYRTQRVDKLVENFSRKSCNDESTLLNEPCISKENEGVNYGLFKNIF